MVARVQLGLIDMVNDAQVTEREKRVQPDEVTQHPDESNLLVSPGRRIVKPADAGLQFRASPNYHLRRSK